LIFDYPDHRAERRHSPSGYASYERYRPWLRDEFDFRCVYCLKRETWGQVTGEFDLDHFEPQSLNPRRQLDYLNLVYACRRCNSVKRDQTVGNPFDLLHSYNIVTRPDGSLHASDHESLRLIRQLDLNSPRLKHWRSMWMRILALAAERDADLYAQLVGFPHDLPDLGALRPPHNHRKEGLDECWFARRRRGELLNVY
jgi:5-methylcytosine-specific restriction endonuclease McrA